MMLFFPTLTQLRRLATDRRGLAMTEFALCLPLLAAVTFVGLENVNYAFAAQKVGDIATLSADSISRIRVGISEDDVTETLTGIAKLGSTLGFTANGRVIVSSIQPVLDASGNIIDQKIRWQRCYGNLTSATSSYGTQGQSLGTAGMGPTGRQVAAIKDNELIFVETIYVYQPLININLFRGQRTMRMLSSMTVRERTANDLVASGTASTC
ncbi:pilus assembly protein [Sphingomonas sp. KR1UV-12]|uniref:Pilus assembly protein n=1 Tax=Sphingomonas aurea TaxID=3063994 RepID=A0ABT9EHY5_9SPHN|nr:pilus assembly protein [Sphingomonas sp. KR1UV-12]MDP1026437.1 pilus assembly protein [Sphingomonas sp. KR1UV-12]